MDSQAIVTLNEINKENEFKFLRAAEISAHVTSITLGPNSSALLDSFESISISNDRKTPEKEKSLKNSDNTRKSFGNKLDVKDLITMHDTIQQQSQEKKIKSETIKKLEEKRIKEEALYKKIQVEIEQLRLDAEMRHKAKVEALEKQIQIELKLENEREQQYLNQRKAMAANSRKILEQQERELEIMRGHLRKIDEEFSKQELQFSMHLQSCSSEMSTIIDVYKKQYKEIKIFKEHQKTSVQGLKQALNKLETVTQNLVKEKIEYENILKSRLVAQKEAEEKQRAEQEAAKQALEAENAAKIAAQQQQQLSQKASTADNSLQSSYHKQFNEYKKLLATKKAQTRLLDETPELQQIRFALKFAINNSINLLNEKNKTTLIEGFQKLMNLLSGQRISTTKGNVSITDHNEAADWCRLRIAEKIFDRCDKEPGLIFFSAALAIALWQKFPDFGEIFLALLYKECPFLMPFKPFMMTNQSNDDFLQSWGFRLKEDGSCEAHNIYEGRTTKFAGLLAALWITPSRCGELENPFAIEFGWRYLAAVLNNPPDTNNLHIMGKVLETAGFALHQTYGTQFSKIMMTIRESYIPAVQSNIDEETNAPFNRLRDTVGRFFAENKFDEPKGRLVAGYW